MDFALLLGLLIGAIGGGVLTYFSRHPIRYNILILIGVVGLGMVPRFYLSPLGELRYIVAWMLGVTLTFLVPVVVRYWRRLR
jgi:hypothetical protein